MRIGGVTSTELFGGTAGRPLAIVRVTLVGDGPGGTRQARGAASGPVAVRVEGPAVATPRPALAREPGPGEQVEVEVGVEVAAPHTTGSPRRVTVIAESGGPGDVAGPGDGIVPAGSAGSADSAGRTAGRAAASRVEQAATITVADPGWTMWMVSHFHYDPVWWSTQGQYTESRIFLPEADGSLPDSRTAFELVRLHLGAARHDPDYKFVLAEIDYLKPHFDAHPEDRADLLAFIRAGRIEIVGGSYNEPNTNLTCAESTIRNAVFGLGFQREVLGADPSAAWMLDAFGHDPSYPGLMAAAGLTESAWARGPFHQWGPHRTVGDNRRMQFPSEFEWLSADGGGLLTSYMPNHYGAGWVTHTAASLEEAEQAAYEQFRQLAPVAATRNVLLPVGADHVIPSRWATGIHRDWNSRYVWPRFVTAVPSEFFAAVRKDAAERDVWITPQTRDMNPVYTGKDVSYVDTKQAQRVAETAVLDGERLATLAWLAGAEYPAATLDKAWRQLVFGAHHDAITGTESDQVYLDLLAGWREAYERGDAARREAAGYLAGLAATAVARDPDPGGDPAGPAGPAAEHAVLERTGRAVVVFNTLSWPRSALARVTLEFPDPGTPWAGLRDAAGDAVPALAEGVIRHDDGTLARLTLAFRAEDVPALGYRTYLAVPEEAGASAGEGWAPLDGTVIENRAFLVEADPVRGGSLTRVLDKRLGTELLTGPGNELVLQDEYASHPRWGEGPWLLSPKGPGRGSASRTARVRAERCPVGARLVAELDFDDLRVTQETLLWDGADRVEFRTHVDGSIGQDRLLRVRFPARVPGGLPVYQTALTVIGRPFGSADTDVAEHEFTLDNPAHEWFGIGSTARVAVTGPAGARFRPPPRAHAIGVAEVITPQSHNGWREPVRDLMVTLARAGVTATCSRPDGPRYGSIDVDSNLPDVRVALGGPAENPFTAEVLAAAGPDTAAALNRLAAAGVARLWVPGRLTAEEAFAPGADLRGALDLPVLIVAGHDLGAAIAAVTADLLDAVIEAEEDGAPGSAGPGPAGLAGHSVALLNRGTPSSLVTPDGTLNISLMRSCSAWPCGVWIDGDRRAVPDGSSFAWQHWSHTFEYALAAGPGDWRGAGFPQAGQDYNHDLLACETSLHDGPLPATASLAAAEPATAWVSALKPRGNPLSPAASQPRPQDGVIVRLRDASGRATATTASVTLFTGVTAAARTDPCEQDSGLPVPLLGGAAEAELPPAGTVTMVLTPGGLSGPAPPAPEPAQSAPSAPSALEPAQPVFSRYWLHGKGPAPAGNLPVAVHLSPGRIALPEASGDSEDVTAELCLTVACGPAPAAGTVQLAADSGIVLEPAGPLRYDLGPRGYARWDLAVRARPGAPRGRHFVAARIADSAGQLLEDAALVSVGEPPPPALDRPLDELLPLYEADQQATAAELDLTLLTPHPQLRPGGRGEIAVRLSNATASQIRGEAQLVSPIGSWAEARPWTQGFTAEPSGGVTLTFTVAVPATARPGEEWWALVKIMYFGRVRYSEPAAVAITDRDRP